MFRVRRLALILWLGLNLTLVCQGHISMHGSRQTEPHIAFLGEPAGDDGSRDTGTGIGSDPGGAQPAYTTTNLPGEGLPAVIHMVPNGQGTTACPTSYILCDGAQDQAYSRMVCGPEPPPPRA